MFAPCFASGAALPPPRRRPPRARVTCAASVERGAAASGERGAAASGERGAAAAARRVRGAAAALARLEALTRPGRPFDAARFAALPARARGPDQMLGRLSPGCEGTHGVFPKCNFACTPCYHGEDANRVRVDGMHTVTEVARQMHAMRALRGPVGHCQLIGGEVSLLPAEDHAAALEVMRFYGRIPMSFTHGDFDYEYLKRLAVLPNGRPRFDRLDFAVHFDMYMVGRRAAPGEPRLTRPTCEADLSRARRRFVGMFERLRREHGVRYYLAHNMTVQDGNLAQLASVVSDVHDAGFRMMSFQPAAQQGDQRRWRGSFSRAAADHGDHVWREVERGAGARLPFGVFQMGDVRCNRTCLVGLVGPRGRARVVPFFDDRCEADLRLRDDAIVKHVGNVVLPPRVLALKVLRVLVTRFWIIPAVLAWAARFAARAGGAHRVLRYGVRMVTFVMHRFMDADDVSEAWALMEAGVSADGPEVQECSPQVRETVERLSACSYGMAHHDKNRVVPACVQHSVYDAEENAALKVQLKLSEPPQSAVDTGVSTVAS